MLDKLHTLSNVGLFEKGTPRAVQFEKATFIYAENGRGKSTLTAVLRAASEGDGKAVVARRTLDSSSRQKVGMLLGTSAVSFEDGAWVGTASSLVVFDGEFVERNVYSGAEVRPDQRQSLLDFALGDSAVALKREVERITAAASEVTKQRTAAENLLTGFRGSLALKTFRDLPADPDVDSKIEALKNRIALARQQQGILKRPDPTPLTMLSPNLKPLFELLRRSLSGIEESAETMVKAHIAEHAVRGLEPWISQGQMFMGNSCPFCGQGLAGVDLVRAYQSYFNKAYNDLKDQVASLHTRIMSEVPERFSQSLIDADRTNRERIIAWEDNLKVLPPDIDASSIAQQIEAIRKILVGLASAKRENPLESVATTQASQDIENRKVLVNSAIDSYNKAILIINSAISDYKRSLAGSDVAALENQLRQLEVQKKRHNPEVVKAMKDFDAADTTKSELEKGKVDTRGKLDVLMKTTLESYREDINAWLLKFAAAFSIEEMKPNYQGGGLPRTDFGLKIRNKPVTLGSRGSGEPSFGNTLSEGDKRTLAFAFFLARLFKRRDLKHISVVIDDPVTSLDKNRRSRTKEAISNIASDCEQVVVLAHDAFFLRDLEKTVREKVKVATKVLEIKRVVNGYSAIDDCDLDLICASDYFHHYVLVQDFVDAVGAPSLREVAKALRPLVEGHLHRRFPRHIKEGVTLGVVVTAIKDSVVSSPLTSLKLSASSLSALNDYASRYHHDTNPAADTEPVTDAELLSYSQQALKLIHTGGI